MKVASAKNALKIDSCAIMKRHQVPKATLQPRSRTRTSRKKTLVAPPFTQLSLLQLVYLKKLTYLKSLENANKLLIRTL